jgi:hypothetical protein
MSDELHIEPYHDVTARMEAATDELGRAEWRAWPSACGTAGRIGRAKTACTRWHLASRKSDKMTDFSRDPFKVED